MSKTYSNFVNGQWMTSRTERTFSVTNPAHRNETVASFQASDASDVRRAVDAACGAFDAWARTGASKRGSYLRKAAEILAKRRDEAANLLTREEGKILMESRGEVDRSISLLEFYGAQGSMIGGETIPSTFDNRFLYTTRSPLGPTALITPWNFPSAIPVWKSAPAVLCGNTVVLKPAEQAPASACLFAECLSEAGLPPGVFNLVTGGADVGKALVADERIKCISFTGSVEVGRAIMKEHAHRLIRIGLEMGGKNPHIVMDDADLDRAVTDVTVGAFWGAGHKCTACSRAIVLQSVYDAFMEKLVKRTTDLRVGDGLDSNTQVPPLLDETLLNKSLEYIALAQQEGATLLVGGKRLTGNHYDDGYYVAPTIFANVTPQMRIAREEIFGPILAVIKVKDFNEALTVANKVDFGLSAGISTRSLATWIDFARRIDAGVIHVNNPTAGLELQAPFGGCKMSTSGSREMGRAAIDFYSMTKTVYVDA
jgi:acyl-CoA reductase-like NAD-dependent aldehyde dehydrogenase